MHQEPSAKAKKVTLKFEAPEEVPLLDVDPRRMGQVVDNLVENAIKYSPMGSMCVINVWCEDDELGISVRDHGQGIAQNGRRSASGF